MSDKKVFTFDNHSAHYTGLPNTGLSNTELNNTDVKLQVNDINTSLLDHPKVNNVTKLVISIMSLVYNLVLGIIYMVTLEYRDHIDNAMLQYLHVTYIVHLVIFALQLFLLTMNTKFYKLNVKILVYGYELSIINGVMGVIGIYMYSHYTYNYRMILLVEFLCSVGILILHVLHMLVLFCGTELLNSVQKK